MLTLDLDIRGGTAEDRGVKRGALLLAILMALAIMPTAQARPTIDYRGRVGEHTVMRFTVVKRDSGRRFIVAASTGESPVTCEGDSSLVGVGYDYRDLNIRLRDDRPFHFDRHAFGGDGLFHAEGQIGWRNGEGTFVFNGQDDGDTCTSGELTWTVERKSLQT